MDNAAISQNLIESSFDLITFILQKILEGLGVSDGSPGVFATVGPAMQYLLSSLVFLEVVIIGFMVAFQKIHAFIAVVHLFVLGLCLYAYLSWLSIFQMIFKSFLALTNILFGTIPKFNSDIFFRPGKIMQFGMETAANYIQESLNYQHWYDVLNPLMLLNILTAAVILYTFLSITTKAVLLIVEVYLLILGGMVLFPFSMFRHTKSLAGKAFHAMFSYGLEFFLFATIFAVSIPIYTKFAELAKQNSSSVVSLLVIMLGSVCLKSIFAHAPSNVARALMSGGGSGGQGVGGLAAVPGAAMAASAVRSSATGFAGQVGGVLGKAGMSEAAKLIKYFK